MIAVRPEAERSARYCRRRRLLNCGIWTRAGELRGFYVTNWFNLVLALVLKLYVIFHSSPYTFVIFIQINCTFTTIIPPVLSKISALEQLVTVYTTRYDYMNLFSSPNFSADIFMLSHTDSTATEGLSSSPQSNSTCKFLFLTIICNKNHFKNFTGKIIYRRVISKLGINWIKSQSKYNAYEIVVFDNP